MATDKLTIETEEVEFKVGNKYIVIDETQNNGHKFEEGTVVTLIEEWCNGVHEYADEDGEQWFLRAQDVAPYKE